MRKTVWINAWINPLWLPPLIVLAGCGGAIPEPQQGDDMLAVYERHTGGSALIPGQRGADTPPLAPVADYVRDVRNETDNLFHRLPNPTLFLFIPPHVVGNEGLPVPGYTVPVPMYKTTPYALPGEVRR